MRSLPATSVLIASTVTWSFGAISKVVDYGARNDGSEPATAAFRSATEAMLHGSRAFPGTGTFLSVAPGQVKGLVMQGNALQLPMVAEPATEWAQ